MRKIIPLVEKLGGKKQVFALLRQHTNDKRTTVESLRRWEERGGVSGRATSELLKLAEMLNVPYSASDLLATYPSDDSAKASA